MRVHTTRKDKETGLQIVEMTQYEFDSLLEYSTTLPTGTIPGKRWKRNCGKFWVMGMFFENTRNPELMNIEWSYIEVVDQPEVSAEVEISLIEAHLNAMNDCKHSFPRDVIDGHCENCGRSTFQVLDDDRERNRLRNMLEELKSKCV